MPVREYTDYDRQQMELHASEYFGNGDGRIYEEQYGNPNIYAKVDEFIPGYKGVGMSRNQIAESFFLLGYFTLVAGLFGFGFLVRKKGP